MAWASSFSPSPPPPPHSPGHSHTRGPPRWVWCLSLRAVHTSLLGEGNRCMVSGDQGSSWGGHGVGVATVCLSSDGLRDLARPSLHCASLVDGLVTRRNICTTEWLSQALRVGGEGGRGSPLLRGAPLLTSTQGLPAAVSKSQDWEKMSKRHCWEWMASRWGSGWAWRRRRDPVSPQG